jgi:putative FmdB family regulatory protein
MPLYEYSCPKCGRQFEELTRAADADKVACPKCKTRAERKFSTFGVAMAPAKSSGGPSPGCATCPSAAGGSCPYH